MAATVIYIYRPIVHVHCPVLLHTVLQAGVQVASSDKACVQSASLLALKTCLRAPE